MNTTIDLHNEWKLWYHSSKNTSWNNQSYKNIYNIDCLYDVKFLIDSINLNHIKTGMFFIMKAHIFPNWEDKENKHGCCISYKIYDNIVKEKWNYIILEVLLNNIEIKNNHINGISIVPKKNYCIIKIWLKNNIRKNDIKCINIQDSSFDNKNALVKKNLN